MFGANYFGSPYFGLNNGYPITTTETDSHTTDALKRKQSVLTHTTDSLKRKANTVSHTTSANKKKAFTVTHTTDANKRKASVVSHTTDSLKRAVVTRTHTTDSFLRRQVSTTHTTDSNKKKVSVVTHTTDSLISDYRLYSHESTDILPTGDDPLANSYTNSDIVDVTDEDSVYVCAEGFEDYLIHNFAYLHSNGSDTINLLWKGKASIAPSVQPVYLQIYNSVSGEWETLDSDSTTAAETDFTLQGIANVNAYEYYVGVDQNFKITARVYQGVV